MELEYIREFLELSVLCNYSETADRLFISQSALYKHIKTLESEIGVPLFIKTGKRIVISPYGQMFLPYATDTLKSVDMFMREVEAKRTENSDVVLIGTQYRITDIISAFRRKYNKYILRTIESGSKYEILYKECCEISFINNFENTDGKYLSIPYATDHLGVVLYPSHPLAKCEKISIKDLCKEDFVALTSDVFTNDPGLEICREAGFIPRVVLTARSGSEVARLVAEGLGIALLYKRSILGYSHENIVIVDIDPVVECNISMCYRKDGTLSAGAKAFIDFAKQSFIPNIPKN